MLDLQSIINLRMVCTKFSKIFPKIKIITVFQNTGESLPTLIPRIHQDVLIISHERYQQLVQCFQKNPNMLHSIENTIIIDNTNIRTHTIHKTTIPIYQQDHSRSPLFPLNIYSQNA